MRFIAAVTVLVAVTLTGCSEKSTPKPTSTTTTAEPAQKKANPSEAPAKKESSKKDAEKKEADKSNKEESSVESVEGVDSVRVTKGDKFCQEKTGKTASYCKTWLHVKTCHLDDSIKCDIEVREVAEEEHADAPKETVVPAPVDVSVNKGDKFCQEKTGNAGSYCKHWLHEKTCQGDDSIKCNVPDSRDADCQKATGNAASYCKHWLHKQTCQYDDTILCSDAAAAPKETVVPAPVDVNVNKGDKFCQEKTGNAASYCKHWLHEKTCQGDDSVKCEATATTDDRDSECMRKTGNDASYCKHWLHTPTCQYDDKVVCSTAALV